MSPDPGGPQRPVYKRVRGAWKPQLCSIPTVPTIPHRCASLAYRVPLVCVTHITHHSHPPSSRLYLNSLWPSTNPSSGKCPSSPGCSGKPSDSEKKQEALVSPSAHLEEDILGRGRSRKSLFCLWRLLHQTSSGLSAQAGRAAQLRPGRAGVGSA